MADRNDLGLAVRVIVVTTRAGVRSHQRTGSRELIDPTVDRGLQLLDSLPASHPQVLSEADGRALAEARRELLELREEAATPARRG